MEAGGGGSVAAGERAAGGMTTDGGREDVCKGSIESTDSSHSKPILTRVVG